MSIGATVLPAAMATAAAVELIGSLTANAAAAMAGATPYPPASNPITATAVGGHSGVTLPRTNDSSRPRRADP